KEIYFSQGIDLHVIKTDWTEESIDKLSDGSIDGLIYTNVHVFPAYAPAAHVDPDVGFLATVPGSQLEDIAERYQRARGARIGQQVSPVRPHTQFPIAQDMSWVPSLTPPSGGIAGEFPRAPAF
ncbi:MAG: hypothetical protein Q8875_02955, partial [Pigeon pea little leaf phytoplasma]|nr:hypothetical protein [Pigeon pea little leaf phytoplasma]